MRKREHYARSKRGTLQAKSLGISGGGTRSLCSPGAPTSTAGSIDGKFGQIK